LTQLEGDPVQKTRRVLVDDLDGSPDATTVQFGIDGRSYEIDLSSANAERLRHVFAGYVERARVVPHGRADRRISPSAGHGASDAMRKAERKVARHVGHRDGSGPSTRVTARHPTGERVRGGFPDSASGLPTQPGSLGAVQDGAPADLRQALLDVLVALLGVLGSLGARRGPAG
jgi:hypothetical protein